MENAIHIDDPNVIVQPTAPFGKANANRSTEKLVAIAARMVGIVFIATSSGIFAFALLAVYGGFPLVFA